MIPPTLVAYGADGGAVISREIDVSDLVLEPRADGLYFTVSERFRFAPTPRWWTRLRVWLRRRPVSVAIAGFRLHVGTATYAHEMSTVVLQPGDEIQARWEIHLSPYQLRSTR